jgi:pilus assembly protein CpaB
MGAGALPDGAFASKGETHPQGGRRVVLSQFNRNEPVVSSKITGPGQRGTLSRCWRGPPRSLCASTTRGVAGFVLPGTHRRVLIGEDPHSSARGIQSFSHVKVLATDQLASERQEQATVAKAVKSSDP